MQHHRANLSPLPDVRRAPSAPPRVPVGSSPLPPASDFIIIALFALRLAKRLIEGLEYYPGRDADIIWLVNFLAPFGNDFSLAKISGRQKDDYVHMYPSIVSRMKKQPRFPVRFMQMNPDRSLLQPPQPHSETERPREMTDAERLEIIDFCDAAAEWGSRVPIPAREADRMIELAGQRRIADLDLEQRQGRPREQGREDVRAGRGRHVSFKDERQEFGERRH